MFHKTVIERKVLAIERAKKIKLIEHTIEECQKLYDHFKSLEAVSGKKTVYCRPGSTPDKFEYTKQEQAWIQNEMFLCACSFPYWFFRYFFIKSTIEKDGEVVSETIRRPDVWVSQLIYLAILADLDLLGLPILLLILKARQLGCSTITEAIILWIAIFTKGSHTVVASAEASKSEEMANMVWLGLEMMPLWMQPVLTRDDRTMGPEFGLIHSDILLQHGSMTKGISRGSTPIAAHLCLRGDSLVDVENGDLKPIQEIEIGDTVITHSGGRAEVSAISRIPAGDKRIVEIRTWMNKERLSLTADHKVFTKRGWTEAGKLTEKDWIGTAIRKFTDRVRFVFTPDIRDSIGRAKRGKCGRMLFPLNEETGFAVGYYIAEGCLKFNPLGASVITYALNQSEYRYAERAKSALKKFCTSFTMFDRPGTKTTILHAYGSSLASFFHENFGSVDSKRIPEWVFESNPEFSKGIIAGYFSGDGSKSAKGMVQATSVRPRILYQIRHLMAATGAGWGGITTEEGFVDHRGWNNSKSWTLTVSGEPCDTLKRYMGVEFPECRAIRDCVKKYAISDGHVWTRVRAVAESEADEVWDIEVDHKDHSFETVIGAVANSEVAYYPNPIETIQSSLIRAMHENPRTFLALESTARKKDDWFHNTWKKNRKGEQEGYNRFICLFLPWYVGRDIYPTPDFLKSHPIPKDWKPLKETLSQAADARLYVSTTELLKKHMPENWEMPREQMWFWEFNYVEAKNGTDEDYKSFLAELAADERSCFQSKKWSVFSQKVLDELEANRSNKYQDFAMCGDGIDPKFHLKDFQSNSATRIDINWTTIEGRMLSWRLIPLKETPRDKNLDFFLRVWEKPKPGNKYTIGIDIASGTGGNRTVYFVNKEGRNGDPDEEVALLCSAWIASPETPAFANLLGIWYGTHMPFPHEAMLAPEVQISTGDFISFQLAKLGYSNFYYMTRFDQRKPPGQKPTRRGWASVSWSKQMMLESFEHGIKSGWIQVNSEELIEECGNLEVDETDSGKTVYDHAREKTNDVYTAGGVAYFCTHGEQTISERMKGSLKPKKKKKDEELKAEVDSGATLLARRFQIEDRQKFPNAGDESEGDPLSYIY